MWLFGHRERRERKTTHLKEFCPTAFEHQGRHYEALMIDLSRKGAQFGMKQPGIVFPLAKGEEAEFRIKTPYGTSQARGVVRWITKTNDRYQWGIEFTALPCGENDPLMTYISSPF